MAFEVIKIFFTFTLLLTIFPMISSHTDPSLFHQIIKPSPFTFLKHLQGTHKGEKVSGLDDLKNYLHRFGYLSYARNPSRHVDSEVFDDQLELALKTYQLNFNLNATGILDADTVAQMAMSRCGVADIINGTTRMRSGEKKRHHTHAHFHTVSHYTFFQGSPKWPSPKLHLTYAFLPSVPVNFRRPVTLAFYTWAAQSPFTFTRVSVRRNPDLRISFGRRDHGDGAPFDGAGGVIAHAFGPTDGRLHFDGDEHFAVGAVSGAFDLQSIALHEIGHLLGLGHSSDPNAVMFPGIAAGVMKPLNADDIAGMKALYN